MQNVAVEITPLATLAKAVIAHARDAHFVLLSVDKHRTGEMAHLLIVSLMKSVNYILFLIWVTLKQCIIILSIYLFCFFNV